MKPTTRVSAGALAAATVFALAACGDDSDGGSGSGGSGGADSAASDFDGDIGATDLSAVCPENVVIQTDWFPEAEFGPMYEALDPAGDGADHVTVDTDAKKVSGPLFDGDNGYTGVDLEVRSGGPAIGNQSVTSQMYQDPDILLGYIDSDESIQQSDSMPTTGVMATMDKSPQMIMWDPETYPDVREIADLKDENATVLVFPDKAYVDYLVGAGILDRSQIDESYDGAPATFVAAGGANAQQGFSSSEPYNYENEIDGWMKPVDYQLVHDAGYPTYKGALAAKSDGLADGSATRDCLSELVPVLQRSTAAYMADPSGTNGFIVDIVEDFNAGWTYDAGNASYGHETLRDEGIIADGADGVLGSFDDARIDELVDIVTPIFAEQNTTVKDGLSPDEIGTNEFLDTEVSLQ